MGTIPMRTARPYQSRPGRAAVVVDDLSTLRGPTSGVVELPHRLLWRPDRSIDLSESWQLAAMYEVVLVEAVRVDELRDWLDRATLVRLWGELYLPRGVRRAWEDVHPALRRMQ
ncbi:hypothetical protein, partial [Micromonospora aurantiaca (nom. illeg.)]|uniref:hypothetical protein n=1 Tax=Micromonospora aurantiaca (nom. illeg.) TaxID=47850 RepID=UPI00378D1529